MDIIQFTITNPVKVAVGVILVCLFGLLALFQIPIQLTPDVDEPTVTVTTRWPGKSAREIEREIIDRQEEKLKGVSGLRKMTSEAVEGQGTVTLEFFIGIDKQEALFESDEKLNQVSDYPPDIEKPEIEAADAAQANAIAWMLLYAQDPDVDVATLRDFVWEEVKPMLERVEGLSSVDVYGGRERETQVYIDPALLAARGITLRQVETALKGENVTVSAGTRTVGKRDFIYRADAEYRDPEQVRDTVIAYQDGGPVYIRDVGKVVVSHEKVRSFVRAKGEPVLAIPAHRETGANVIEVMNGLRKQIQRVNKEILGPRNLSLELTQVYDETTYITSAIDLVRSNLIFGGALATIVLLVFLRSVRATAIVALSIPISVIATFLVVSLLGRNINVVMLAGMAFAVGMVVDNAVVVLENIYRHKQMGKTGWQAAYDGGKEVWGAILASTLTTMAVFVPVIFIQEEAGQLFRDIAIAISAGVAMSLLVAVLVIPTIAARLFGRGKVEVGDKKPKEYTSTFANLTSGFVAAINSSLLLQILVIVFFVAGSLIGSILLLPPSDYLPSGNRNLVFGFGFTEPGLSPEAFTRMAKAIEQRIEPYWEAELGEKSAENLPPIQMPLGSAAPGQPAHMVEVQPPPIDNFFFVMFNNQCFMGATSQDQDNVKPLQNVLQNAAYGQSVMSGAQFFFQQASLFTSVRSSSGSTVDVEIRSQDINKVNRSAGMILGMVMQQFGFPRPTPPNFDLLRPEIRAVPDRAKAADVGLNVADIGFVLEAAVDGAYVGAYRQEGDEIDLRVYLRNLYTPDGNLENAEVRPIDDVRTVPLYSPRGDLIPLMSVTHFEEVGAPQQINHIEEMPGVTLTVQARPGEAIETVMNIIDNDIVQPLRDRGMIPDDVYISLAGTADKLVQTRTAMFGHWTGFNAQSLLALLQSRGFLALIVVYLLMAALFESFVYPLAILFSVPLAMVGGFAGLKFVHWLSLMNPVTPIQQMDVVTMLGFVILLGIVVNNAILIVHQTLNNMSEGNMAPQEALRESVRTRVRPIFMTAFTTIGGQLPLALMSGAGSELYRGLAAVMVGGLLVSTLFTVILVPVVFSIFLYIRELLMKALGREAKIKIEAAG